MDALTLHAEEMTESLLDELATWLPLAQRPVVNRSYERMMRPSMRRFSQLLAEFDHRVGADSIYRAARWLMPRFARTFTVHGAEHIPADGPLLIAGNHPGSVDLLAYLAGVPRDDLHMVGGHPALYLLHNSIQHIIYVRPKQQRIKGEVTQAISDKLNEGKTVITFPRGRMEPDPRWLEGADQSIERWSTSTRYFAENVPGLQIVPAVVSGVIADSALNLPVIRAIRNMKTRQRYAMFYTLTRNAVRAQSVPIDVRIQFGPALTLAQKGSWLLSAVKTEAQALLPRARDPRAFPLDRGMRGWFYTRRAE